MNVESHFTKVKFYPVSRFGTLENEDFTTLLIMFPVLNDSFGDCVTDFQWKHLEVGFSDTVYRPCKRFSIIPETWVK